VALALLLVHAQLLSYFRRSAFEDVRATRVTLDATLRDSLEAYRTTGRIVTEETLLKEALLQGSRELAFTYADSADDRAKTELLAVLDAQGRVLSDAKRRFSPGVTLAASSAALRSASRGEVGFTTIDDRLYMAALVP